MRIDYTQGGRVGYQIGGENERDIAAEDESSLTAQEYDTDLNYVGAITYTTNGESPVQGTYWCYFNQIEEVLNDK